MNVRRMQATAKRLINQNGNTCLFLNHTQLPYDSTLGDYPTITKAFKSKMSIEEYHSSELIENVTKMGDVKALVDSKYDIDKNWTVKSGGIEYTIEHIGRTTAKDLITHYVLWLRA